MVKGQDLINLLQDETLVEIMKYLDGRGIDRDAYSLVCKRWRTLESACRHFLTLDETGQSDAYLAKLVQRFPNLRQVCVDEGLPVPVPINGRLSHRQTLCPHMMRPFQWPALT
ncbi:F-box/LRR-repeat protein 4-like [Physcomitrium patens]|uniref:COI1 F-box domain-containing protein n=1 Tax=Physcomitrium patens TaxID=3218 RepID=A0A2K1KEG3_PHYPA|nr:hypothetical protein PHYPA_008537 [Physcomitrium patens]